METINKYYDYENKWLWNDVVWDDRYSKLIPLANKIYDLNAENNLIKARTDYEARGDYDNLQRCWIYPEVVEELNKKGLSFHTTRHTIYISPLTHKDIGYDDPMDTLMVFCTAELPCEAWAMDILARYKKYTDYAATNNMSIMFIMSTPGHYSEYVSLVQEAVTLFRYNWRRMYFDVTPLVNAGVRIADIIKDYPEDLDRQIEKFGEICVLNVSGKWLNRVSLTQGCIMHPTANTAYDKEKVINSNEGRKMADAIKLELMFDDVRDPLLSEHFDHMGLKMDINIFNGEQWLFFTPKNVLESRKKIPVMCVLQETSQFDPHQSVTAISYCYEFFKLAAQGDCCLLFFVREALDDNDMLHDILQVAFKDYPIDPSRVYITGHSHDGRFTAEYTRRHPLEIACMCTLGNEPGQLHPDWTSGFFQVSDEKIQLQGSYDIPTINLSGYYERNCMFPLNCNAPNMATGSRIAVDTKEKRIKSWQRRLISARCPMKTTEEIEATKYSNDYVERKLGIPADKTDCLYLDGHEIYIADIKNVDGKFHLRIVALDDMPHSITPTMTDMAWSYARRFARNLETGEVIELY